MQADRFSPAAALALVPQICDALHYGHSEGILHRDIKPENILLDTKGRVKIADFGIAKLVQEKDSTIPLTGTGSALGTPHYMAPEQLQTPNQVDQRADIYSLGVVFYELLTGELPIGRFSLPSEKSTVDPRVDPIVLKALEREKERRFHSASEVKTSVQQVVSAPAQASPPPPVQDVRPLQTARGATASLVLTLLSLVPALVLFFAIFRSVIPRPPQGAPPPLLALVPFALLLLLILALLSLPGFGLGLSALIQIRNSSGKLGGKIRALIGTLSWPIVILLTITSFLAARVVGSFIGGSPVMVLITAVIPLLLSAGLATWTWRSAPHQSSKDSASWWLFTLICLVLLIPTLMVSFLSSVIVSRRLSRMDSPDSQPQTVDLALSPPEAVTIPHRGRVIR